MAGRPKISPEKQQVILNAVRAAVPLNRAAALAGVHVSTVHAWKAKGKVAKDGPYREFFDALKREEGVFITKALTEIQAIAKNAKQWTAWAWILERRWPEEFGQSRHEITELKKQLKELENLIRGNGQPNAGNGATASG
jgi:hypothetical protein